AVAIPTGEEPPIVLDMAVSVVAGGKLEIARRKGEKIPFGWAIDKDGNPTDDPVAALGGSVLPLGGAQAGYKGYALAFVFEVLCGVLMGARFGRQNGSIPGPEQSWHNGHFFQAIDVK